MQTEELIKIIEDDENQQIEFKVNDRENIGESICSFANTNNGTIIVGISGDRRKQPEDRIVGVSEKVEEKIASITHSCKPSVYPEIIKEYHNGKLILFINVPYSGGTHHSFKNIVYKRVGSSDNPLSPDEVINIAKRQRIIRFDEQLCDAKISDIDEKKLRDFVISAKENRNLDINSHAQTGEILEKLNLLREDRLTYASVLLFGRKPQQYVPQSGVRCARFKGTELNFLDMKVLDGSVIEQIEDAGKFVLNNIRTEALVVPDRFTRTERPEYPFLAIKEAITNAVCHRDYFSTANVHVSIFDDRIEIWNPGGLPPELTIEDLKGTHSSIPRNQLIADALFLSKHIERWGTGTQRMIQDMLAYALPEPDFAQVRGGFEVVFRNAEAVLKTLNERQRQAWNYLRENETITRSIYADLCICPPTTALSDIQDLVKKGILKREGIGKATVYRRIR